MSEVLRLLPDSLLEVSSDADIVPFTLASSFLRVLYLVRIAAFSAADIVGSESVWVFSFLSWGVTVESSYNGVNAYRATYAKSEPNEQQ